MGFISFVIMEKGRVCERKRRGEVLLDSGGDV